MGFIKPSISENLKFSTETGINEKGSLKIVMEADVSEEAMMEAMMNDQVIDTAKGGFLLYTPNLLDFDDNPRSVIEILKDLTKYKERFIEYGAVLGDEAGAKEAFGNLKMFNIFPEAQRGKMMKRVTEEEVLNQVFQNLCKLFYNWLINHPNLESTRFRHKFHRQSAAKSFPNIPFTYDMPIVESMSVPKTESKIQWAKWEIEKKKNDASETAPDVTPDEGTDATAELFDAPTDPGVDENPPTGTHDNVEVQEHPELFD
jgi:hypothetical protein